MDEEGVERCFLFPTLGVSVEGFFRDNMAMAYKAYHAFNRWMADDWGYCYQDRLYASPHIPLFGPELAVKELDYVLNQGAGSSPPRSVRRVVGLRLIRCGIPSGSHRRGRSAGGVPRSGRTR